MSTGLADGRALEAGRAHTALYQCGAQTPSNGLGPAGQASISAWKAMPSAWHNAPERRRRVGQHVVGIDHRRRPAEPLGDHVEDLRLLHKADIAQA